MQQALEQTKFSLKLFYKKRIFRIWPLYYLIIILGLFVIPNIPFLEYHSEHIGNINDVPPDVAFKLKTAYLLFVPHIAMFFDSVSYVAHTWSIGAEEQFYLIWPLLLMLFYKRSIRLSLICIIGLAVLQITAYYMGWTTLFAYLGISRISAMILGGFFAMVYHNSHIPSVKRFLDFFTTKWVEILALIAVPVVFMTHVQLAGIKHEVFAIVSGFVILNAATKANGIVKLENQRWLSYLGKISYGLYMYHPIVIGIVLHLLDQYTGQYFSTPFSNVLLYALVMGATILVSAVSYELIEKRLVKMARA